ncbi:CsbD family protein [Streptomyces sp. NPDC091209]|uniref:CsbD family protein n=1 Tax=Streptomyces sp. NPDC091209 TaxID=3365974 RepID=UPI003825BC55
MHLSKAKEAVGKATGSDRMKAEGQMDQAEGKAKDAMDDVKEPMRGKHGKRGKDRSGDR